jgi:uncharacterized protein
VRRFNLRSLRFGPDDEVWRSLPVETDPFVFGGFEYTVDDGVVELELEASRVGDRITLKASLETVLAGPCQRCLGEARIPVAAGGYDVVQHGDSEGGDEEGGEGYAHGHVLDAERWVRDLIGDALPLQLLCREDCAGLCPVCGANMNDDPGHRHEGAPAPVEESPEA